MIRIALAVPLLAAAILYKVVAVQPPVGANISTHTRATGSIPGAYIFEFYEDLDTSSAKEAIKAKGKVRMDLDSELFKGMSIQLNDVEGAEEVAKMLADMPAVKKMWPMTVNKIPDPVVEWAGQPQASGRSIHIRDNSSTETYSPHVMTQIDKLRAKGYTGKGIKVAILDSGVDYNHPALGGCFGKGCLVVDGYDFVGDDFTGIGLPAPDEDPMDCTGHGTHVAGIIAAKANPHGFTGGAPGVKLAAYRVFGCSGYMVDDVLIAALNRAYKDGADIINVSLGSGVGWPDAPWAVSLSRMVAKGVPCIVAAANYGRKGIFYAASTVGANVTAVASFNNIITPSLMYTGHYTVDNGTKEFEYAGGTPVDFVGSHPLWANTYDTAVLDDMCTPLPDSTTDLSSYIVLIRSGTCGVSTQAKNAAKNNARYIMFYGNDDKYPVNHPIDSDLSEQVKGVAQTFKTVGESWVKDLRAGKRVVLTLRSSREMTGRIENTANDRTGGGPSSFSSWGPTWTMDIKPQFGAPGGSILSTYPLKKGGYAVTSGTSMAAPLAAAIYALIAEVRGSHDPRMIESLLSATAKPKFINGNIATEEGVYASVAQQGAGLIQAYDAAFATTLLEPLSMSFNDTDNFVPSRNLTIRNHGTNGAITYKISNQPAMSVITIDPEQAGVEPFPGLFYPDLSAEFNLSQSEVTVEQGNSVTIKVSPVLPPDVAVAYLPLWSGWITVSGSDGTSLRVPYQGLSGSLYNQTVLGPDDAWIAKSDDLNHERLDCEMVFVLPRVANPASTEGLLLPEIVVNMTLGSRVVTAKILPAPSDDPADAAREPIGVVADFPRRFVSRIFFNIPWSGTMANGSLVPAGRYQIATEALRLNGDERNPVDWDVSLSRPFRITYREE